MIARCAARVAIVLAAALLLLPATSLAERAWVKDEVRLNIRTGPGVKYRILGTLETGDSMEILSRGEGWTQVRSKSGDGWIPIGFLQPEPPARIRLERFETETADMRERYQRLSKELEELRTQKSDLTSEATERQDEITRLTRDNLELRAGARWPEWIAGAGILFVGSILGMFVHRSATRRPGPRIRL